MKAETQNNSPVFEKIKRSLDPAYSYLIFEKDSEPLDSEVLQDIIVGISRLNLGIFESKIHLDKNLGLSLLVVRVDPERTDKIMQSVINIGMPNDIIFYSYGSRT
jgi:hypothetical protein